MNWGSLIIGNQVTTIWLDETRNLQWYKRQVSLEISTSFC